jgi:hypothetical protein
MHAYLAAHQTGSMWMEVENLIRVAQRFHLTAKSYFHAGLTLFAALPLLHYLQAQQLLNEVCTERNLCAKNSRSKNNQQLIFFINETVDIILEQYRSYNTAILITFLTQLVCTFDLTSPLTQLCLDQFKFMVAHKPILPFHAKCVGAVAEYLTFGEPAVNFGVSVAIDPALLRAGSSRK